MKTEQRGGKNKNKNKNKKKGKYLSTFCTRHVFHAKNVPWMIRSQIEISVPVCFILGFFSFDDVPWIDLKVLLCLLTVREKRKKKRDEKKLKSDELSKISWLVMRK